MPSERSKTPDNIKQYLPCKSTSARLIRGTYYVYKYSAVKLSDGRLGTDSGYAIGKIIPGEIRSQQEVYEGTRRTGNLSLQRWDY